MKKSNSLKWSYNHEFDILFIHRIDEYEYEESVEMTCDVLMDFDTLLNPSAFEFLNASKIFKSNNGDLCDIQKIKVHVSINEDLIKLHVNIFTPNNKLIQSKSSSMISMPLAVKETCLPHNHFF